MVQGATLLLQGMSTGHLPDSGVTAGAGPASAAGTTAGQAQVAVPRHAGLTEKKQRKRKRSKSGIACWSLQVAFLA